MSDPVNPDEFTVEPMMRLVDAAGGKGVKGRLAQVGRFLGEPKSDAGLCLACMNSGFLHEVRDGVLGVVADRSTGYLIRCSCEHGDRIRKVDAEGQREMARR